MLYYYDGTFDGLMTAIYDAFYARVPVVQAHFLPVGGDAMTGGTVDSGSTANLYPNEPALPMTLWETTHQQHPDTREITVTTSQAKAEKVVRALIAKVGYDAYDHSYHVFLSCYPNRGDLIFQYIKLAFAVGSKVFQMLAHPVAGEVARIARRVSRETQHMLGFLRFEELEGGTLFSEIAPTNDLLELLAPHFADRLSGETWCIYDSSRNTACFYRPESGLLFTDQIPPELVAAKKHSQTEGDYQALWRTFFHTIGIEGRYNPKCQQNMMPKKYWKYMTEFQSAELNSRSISVADFVQRNQKDKD